MGVNLFQYKTLVIGKADKTPSQIAMLAIFIRQAVEEMTP